MTGLSEEAVALAEQLQPLYARLAKHRLYAAFRDLDDVKLFMETHVFAVWDFMSLLKSLQRALTCVEVPWLPSTAPESGRLINEIVLGEESDTFRGQVLSHFDLYRLAMREAGADTFAIDNLLRGIGAGERWERALEKSGAHSAAQNFVRATFEFIATGKPHVIASAFTFGREDLIPEIFRGFLRDQDEQLNGRLATFRWYLDRHIEVDGEQHGPMALQMVSELCGDDPIKWSEAAHAAETALSARIALWDGIAESIATHAAPMVQ